MDVDDLARLFPLHRFKGVARLGTPWELSHLDPLVLHVEVEPGVHASVLVLFSCHCFTRSFKYDGRARQAIPREEIFDNGREVRVLCERRYRLSKVHLPGLIRDLPHRVIRLALEDPPNFITVQEVALEGEPQTHYVVFFEVSRDARRRGRLLLHVQSAHVRSPLEPRFSKSRKVSFSTLLRAVRAGRRIRP